jgi:uncharacterized protein (TIGR00266 family)
MNIDIQHGPGAASAHFKLGSGENLTSESGAMIAMNGCDITTTTHKRKSGSIFGGLKRMLSGESFFLNHYSAGQSGGDVWLSTSLAGDMTVLDIQQGNRIVVQSGSYVASEEGIEVGLDWQGFKSLFAKEGLFWINLSGQGKAVINSFGAIYSIDCIDEYIVDTGHIVAFEESLSFKLSKAGKSWISSILGGEGLVCRFKGTGRIWVQSHHSANFGRALGPLLRSR